VTTLVRPDGQLRVALLFIGWTAQARKGFTVREAAARKKVA
jgi:hypothetical protein